MAASAPLTVEGGDVDIGRPAGAPGFAFDNELPGRRLPLAPFEIDAAPVSAGAFLEFVEAGGYDEPSWWPGDAGRWRAGRSARSRRAGARAGARWEQRWFDRWLPLDPMRRVVHVNAWEAEAYCRWAGRRLPRAAEWEQAAADPRFAWGRSVWEWTADAFQAYPGFAPGPYRDYSHPGSATIASCAAARSPPTRGCTTARYRNFFMPDRGDVFAGFRTAALAP